MVQMYQRLGEEEMRQGARAFFEKQIERNIFPEMLGLVEVLRGEGVDIWAVSSTNNWVIEEGVRRFGIPADRVLAARVEVKDGVVTDVLLDVPTDEGKVAALRRAGGAAPEAVFGDSVDDAGRLAGARGGVPVDTQPGVGAGRARGQVR